MKTKKKKVKYTNNLRIEYKFTFIMHAELFR